MNVYYLTKIKSLKKDQYTSCCDKLLKCPPCDKPDITFDTCDCIG